MMLLINPPGIHLYGTGAVKENGKWYRLEKVSQACKSLIEVVSTSQEEDISIHDMTHCFKYYGTTLGQCYTDDSEATMLFLQQKLSWLEYHVMEHTHDYSCYHEYIQFKQDLSYLLKEETDGSQTELQMFLKKMITLCTIALVKIDELGQS